MLTGLRFCYSWSTVSFSTTDGPICGLDSHDKFYWHEDDLRIFYWYKWQIFLELLVLELVVVDQIADKEAANVWIIPKFNFIYKYNNF